MGQPQQRTHAERLAGAHRSFEYFVPEASPERAAAAFTRRLGPLGAFAVEVVGDMWDRPALSRRDRSVAVVSVLAAQARDEELVAHTLIGLRHGLEPAEIEEILLQVAAYAGFPAAMAASRRVDEALRQHHGVERLEPRGGPEALDDEQRDRAAAEVRATMRGRSPADPAEDLAELTERLGGVGEVAYRWVFGEIWSRPQLSRRDRSISTIAILIALGHREPLATHVAAGVHHGLSPTEIEEIATHLSLYAGMPAAVSAMAVMRTSLGAG